MPQFFRAEMYRDWIVQKIKDDTGIDASPKLRREMCEVLKEALIKERNACVETFKPHLSEKEFKPIGDEIDKITQQTQQECEG
ncbi:MAG TPA: hypothetical protein VJ793_00535 [Anaerolineae bacterium]|nr:hypothetical protein [Anaerolineae bacterium]